MVYHTVPSFADDDLDDRSPTYDPKAQFRVENVSDATHDHPVTRSWAGTALMQAFAVAWLIPIAVLLWLNFSNHVIGQSAWCPHGSCDNGTFDADFSIAAANMDRYNKQDHNLLGFLQLVAKALELWFALIGIWLAYLLMIRMASSKQGLPLEYLSRPSRMGQTWASFTPEAWAPLLSRDAPGRLRLWMFFLITLAVSVLSALMGPATAILVLPTQRWAETTPYYFARFQQWNAATPPTLATLVKQNTTCSEEDVAKKSWSCAYAGSGASFDYWALFTFSNGSYGESSAYWFEEDGFSFGANTTSANDNNAAQIPSWVPNRQVVDWFNADSIFYNAIQYEPPLLPDGSNMQVALNPSELAQYQARRKALRLEDRRDGPILGYISNAWPSIPNMFGASNVSSDQGDMFSTQLDSNKAVRCYPYWAYQSQSETVDPQPGNNYTRCIQAGNWGSAHTSNQTFFLNYTAPPNASFIATANLNASDVGMLVTVMSSEKIALLPRGDLPSGFSPDCLYADYTPGCDWDLFFAENVSSPLANLTRFSTTIEMTYPGGGITALDFVAFTNFTQYSLDPSFITNPYSIIQTQNLPLMGSAIPVDPNWYLLTLSVDAGGSIPSVRTVPLLTLSNPNPQIVAGNPAPWEGVATLLFAAFEYTLTIIDFANTTSTTAVTPNATPDALGQQALAFSARYYTWGYGINTSSVRFGAAVAILGILVVAAYLVLSSLDRREHGSITGIIASALDHGTAGMFVSSNLYGKDKGKARFRMVECATPKGRFVPEPAEDPRPYQYVVKDTVDLERSCTPSPILRPEAPHMNVAPPRGSRYYTSS